MLNLVGPVLILSACTYDGLGAPPPEGLWRPERTVVPTVNEQACSGIGASFAPPSDLLDTSRGGCDPDGEGYCFGLRPELRALAREAKPATNLAHAAAELDIFQKAGDDHRRRMALALADLAVSGGRSYARFKSWAPQGPDAIPGDALESSKRTVLERAYRTAWALRGPPQLRQALRPGLGYVAVSSEEDLPHRPVNIPSSPFPQTDFWVSSPLGPIRTRVVIASTEWSPLSSGTDGPKVGLLPQEPELRVPDHGDILIFVHGHASLAEEGAALFPELLRAYREQGKAVTVVAMDQPSNAYAAHLDPTEVGRDDEAVLRFLDHFLIRFVDGLERQQAGIKARIAAVIGGSLGGNLVLRLAERRPKLPWLRRVVAWSPASIDYSWSRAQIFPKLGEEFFDLIKHEAVRLTRDESRKVEKQDSRKSFFTGGLLGVRTQADYWYRGGWRPCKRILIEEGLKQLSEVYEARFRRWHYKVAFEQLIFSHIERVPGASGRWFERIEVPLLLVAGRDDNSVPVKTYDFLQRLAPHLTMPGETLFFMHTGHALHSERPRLLAQEIYGFVHDHLRGEFAP